MDFSKVEIETVELGAGLAMRVGAGGQVGVSTGPDGVLIDDQSAPMTEKIRAAIAKPTPEPVRFVLDTHWHGDHSGGNENLGEAGVLILAHHRGRARMSSGPRLAAMGQAIPPSPKAACRSWAFEDGPTLHLNRRTIEARYVTPAQTHGDPVDRVHPRGRSRVEARMG